MWLGQITSLKLLKVKAANNLTTWLCFSVVLIGTQSCKQQGTLHFVTTQDFHHFVNETGYITDAEQFGWSIVQRTINDFDVVDGATFKRPNGKDASKPDDPVTQVSYNDALAYCKWAHCELPTYQQYWKYATLYKRITNINSDKILEASQSNFVGNTWDITLTKNKKGEVRLAGGSYLCSKETCDGTNPNRKLFVSPDTGNSHISFVVLK